ncbi:purine-binding chemotaxis protein CheW [Priestia taiwanensis]|uniref:Chemotaxis protein CheW n=1 Tax=Priestia taiwanensis TaxID=1347902 RepID=A0A917EQ73_9BACI|nr:purine-binding chemotaxis protein CheW [Priestia taiwanensis]GGE65371.1 chemotaxis protein CheW [Priestia taiwanensis]
METIAEEKVIVFELNHEEYAIPVQQVQSIEKLQYITRVPQTKAYIRGVINLRGVVLPIVDLRLRFGMDAVPHTENTRIIIISIRGTEVGLIVDAANDVLDIPVDSIEAAPKVVGSIHTDYIKGIAKLERRLLNLLHLEKVLQMKEENESLVQ